MTSIRSALVVNCCRNDDVLTLREFVWPIQRVLSVPSKVVSLKKMNEKMVKDFDVIILSGCQLLDNDYLKHLAKVKWLAHSSTPVLGICAGQHILASVFGGRVLGMKTPIIGVHPIKKSKKSTILDSFPSSFNVYGLHSHTVSLPPGFASAARSAHNPNEVIFHLKRPVLGVSFHPEVLNKPLFHAFLAWGESFQK
jgi:GMP synthase-like glutamine amidotransferase